MTGSAVLPVVAVTDRPGAVREEWTRPAPPEWERRLREISPIVEKTSHLRFRWRGEDEQWALYECVPAALLSADRVAQLTVHWTTLPTDQQRGRRVLVTEYQHYMFRVHRVEARLHWILQGSRFIVGGTPAMYTDRERRLLELAEEDAEPIPPGTLPNVPFDERVVSAIQARDRLIRAGNDLDALERSQRPDALKSADEQAEKDFRRSFMDWHRSANAASAEFMKWYLHQKESRFTLRPGDRNDANKMADWRDRYVETGDIGAGVAATTRTSILVT